MLVDRYGNPVIKFSEAEQKTGETWIDGKPIYTKTIQKSYTGRTQLDDTISFASLGISNIDSVFVDGGNSFVKFYIGGIYSGTQPLNINANNDWKACYLRSSGLAFRMNQPGNYATEWYVTLKYTKTTD
ncbi:hypothetical protein ACR75P_05250 [Faecalicoccus pleomorphus]|uniref:hypothetical protein n=1 Tax=Faecalicoccus pleomorphus TaxID=1323 RepID=UPI003DA648C3